MADFTERDIARRRLSREMASSIMAAMARKDQTAEQLDKLTGKAAGYTRKQLTAMETGTTGPSLEFVANLFWALDVVFQWRLLNKRPLPAPQPQKIQIVPIAIPALKDQTPSPGG